MTNLISYSEFLISLFSSSSNDSLMNLFVENEESRESLLKYLFRLSPKLHRFSYSRLSYLSKYFSMPKDLLVLLGSMLPYDNTKDIRYWELRNVVPSYLFFYYQNLASPLSCINSTKSSGKKIIELFGFQDLFESDYLYGRDIQLNPNHFAKLSESENIISTLAIISLSSFKSLKDSWLKGSLRNFYNEMIQDSQISSSLMKTNKGLMIYDFCAKRLLPAWGGSMKLDRHTFGPFLTLSILNKPFKLFLKDERQQLPEFYLNDSISNIAFSKS
tara:strand:+ start:54 stop:872 length:819 start_codon:yes stop_codon:yes gene_type:complete